MTDPQAVYSRQKRSGNDGRGGVMAREDTTAPAHAEAA